MNGNQQLDLIADRQDLVVGVEDFLPGQRFDNVLVDVDMNRPFYSLAQ
jgi:hypothetical protein